jgi:uncharacterized protein (DUF2141 family)
MKRSIFALIGFLCMAVSTPQSGNVVVKFTGLRNSKGKIAVAVYKSPDGFPSRPEKVYKGQVVPIDDKTAQCIFENLPYGEYAMVFFHDENENRNLDTNFIGIPVEGYGVSNNPRSFFGPPKFEDAAFKVNSPLTTIVLEAKYLL